MWDCVKDQEVKVHDIRWIFFIHQCSHSVIRRSPGKQEWFVLDEAIPAVLNQSSPIHVLRWLPEGSFRAQRWGWLVKSSQEFFYPFKMGLIFPFYQSLGTAWMQQGEQLSNCIYHLPGEGRESLSMAGETNILSVFIFFFLPLIVCS